MKNISTRYHTNFVCAFFSSPPRRVDICHLSITLTLVSMNHSKWNFINIYHSGKICSIKQRLCSKSNQRRKVRNIINEGERSGQMQGRRRGRIKSPDYIILDEDKENVIEFIKQTKRSRYI